MLTLIIETSGEKGGLILAKQGQCIASRTLLGGPELSQSLAQEVKDLLAGASPKLIAVGIGPGSYTGIRVGAALAKALAYGWKIPCLGFCSLRAFGLPPILVDARGGGIYALLYCDRSKRVENAKEAPCNLSQAKPTPKALRGPRKRIVFGVRPLQLNLKSLAMQAGLKFSGCPTSADSHFLNGSSMKGGKAVLLSPDEINLMPGIPFFRSPHPDRVQKRLSPDVRVIECDFDAPFLSRDIWEQFCLEGAPPFALNYLTSP